MRALTTGVIVTMLLLGVLSAASGEGETGVDRVLAGVGEHYKDIQSLRCGFEQESHYPSGETFVQKGTLEIKRPAMMRWDYAEPTARQFISDGANLWVYHPDDKRAFLMKELDTAAQARLFGFVIGLEDVRADFDVTLQPDVATPDQIRLLLVPRQEMPGVRRVWVAVAAADSTIIEVTIEDGIGTRTVTRMIDPVANPELADEHFSFTPPEGVEIMPYN